MRRPWTSTSIVFLVLALLGLFGAGICTVLVAVQRRDVFGDIAAGGPFVTSLSVDLGIAAVAGVVLMVVEARRLGMRRVWVYVVLAGVTAFAFAFPLFLCNRERLLADRRAVEIPPGRDQRA